MYTFIFSLIALILGYIFYGTFVEKVFGIDPEAKTPAVTKTDGVDFVPMKPWRIFLVQFLNIAGLGPIFGAIMGIFFGPAAFLWIVVCCQSERVECRCLILLATNLATASNCSCAFCRCYSLYY